MEFGLLQDNNYISIIYIGPGVFLFLFFEIHVDKNKNKYTSGFLLEENDYFPFRNIQLY